MVTQQKVNNEHQLLLLYCPVHNAQFFPIKIISQLFPMIRSLKNSRDSKLSKFYVTARKNDIWGQGVVLFFTFRRSLSWQRRSSKKSSNKLDGLMRFLFLSKIKALQKVSEGKKKKFKTMIKMTKWRRNIPKLLSIFYQLCVIPGIETEQKVSALVDLTPGVEQKRRQTSK